MPALKSQSPLNTHITHSPSFSPVPGLGYYISRKETEVCGSGSPRFFPVICAQMVGLPQFPAPSAVSLVSPVLNPKPHGTSSLPTSKSPFTPFLPAASLLHSSKLLRESSALLLHLAFGLPKLCSPVMVAFPGLNPSTNLLLQPHFWLLLQLVTAASLLGRCGPVVWSQLSPSSSGPHYESLFGVPPLVCTLLLEHKMPSNKHTFQRPSGGFQHRPPGSQANC